MNIDYYKKVNKKISMKLIFGEGDDRKLIFAAKQSKKVSDYNDANEDFKLYDPIEKKTFIFPKNSKIESETISCPHPKINQLEDEYKKVDENNEKFEIIYKKILDVLDRTERSESNIKFLKNNGYKSISLEPLCIKTIDTMNLFQVVDIVSFINNTEENLSKCKENWKNKIIKKANDSISILENEKNSFIEKNDLDSSDEVSIIIEMIEKIKQDVSQDSYFESSNNVEDLIKKWPPILLPIPTE